MIQGKQPSKTGSASAGPGPSTHLPYAIELWNLQRTAPERIIGRAANATLAQAIFAAAQRENLGRRIVLRRGRQVLMESS